MGNDSVHKNSRICFGLKKKKAGDMEMFFIKINESNFVLVVSEWKERKVILPCVIKLPI